MNKITALKTSDSANFFPIERPDFSREWMDAYPHGFAYRCLPMKIANQAGWVIKCPATFEAIYVDNPDPLKSVLFRFEEISPVQRFISSHFGRGVITFSIPYLFRSNDNLSLWIRGIPNYYKENVSFLEGIVETYWAQSTFTYNVRLINKDKLVKFVKGEPLMFITTTNIQEMSAIETEIADIKDFPQEQEALCKWSQSRNTFLSNPRTPDMWQKDYFLGKDSDKNKQSEHITQLNLKEFKKK